MNEELDKLRQQVQDLAGRFIADSALLRMSVLSASTPSLRATHAMLEKLSEETAVRVQIRAMPTASLKAFDDERKQWMQLVHQEIASRESTSDN